MPHWMYAVHGKRQASNDNIDNIIEINAYMQYSYVAFTVVYAQAWTIGSL